MFSSFLKITLRNLYRDKMYALINISGLSIAIACCLILGLYLRSEFTFDRHNLNYRQIFRIINTGPFGKRPLVYSALGPILAKDYPEINNFVRFSNVSTEREILIRCGDKAQRWDGVLYADNSVFDIFTHTIIHGDPKTALVDPTSVAVSSTFAQNYFENANPIGEAIFLNNKTFKITIVFDDLPDNSNLKYDILISYQEKELIDVENNLKPFGIVDCNTYLLMPEGYTTHDFKPISEAIYSRYIAKAKVGFPEINEYWLQPISDIHFNSEIMGENTGNKFYIYGFTAVAVFILLAACINYMNLATARASKRAKGIGIRKILGAGTAGLKLQFMGEAIFLSLVALFFSLVLVEIALNLFPINDLLHKQLALNLGSDSGFYLWLLLFSIIVGVGAGSYPAFYLSSLPVLSAPVSGYRAGKNSAHFRHVLVTIQYVFAVSVIACTLLMGLQMHYVSEKPLGFEKENRILITLYGDDIIDKIPTIKKELLKDSRILAITQSASNIGEVNAMVFLPKRNGETEKIPIIEVDDNYLEVMGMQIVSGRDFTKTLLMDIGESCIINEAMVKMKDWEEPIGEKMGRRKVIGVVNDFHFESLHNPVQPLEIIRLKDSTVKNLSRMRQLILHISETDIPGTLSFLEEKFTEFDPTYLFDYEFLDEFLDNRYISEHRLTKLIGTLGGICIFISCLGLFGLSACITEQRTKEIGIRKVLGASTWQIICMLFRNILLLVLGGGIIASLISYYTIDEWLTGFAYHTNINPWVFLLSAAVAAVVAFATVALQSFKTAQANPVNALRYE